MNTPLDIKVVENILPMANETKMRMFLSIENRVDFDGSGELKEVRI